MGVLQEALEAMIVQFQVMAPSGVAAAIHSTGRTVHRVLGLGRINRPDFWTSRKGRAVLEQLKHYQGVIFDEVSFAGVELMAKFFQAMANLREQGHLMHVVVVGDMYQLPPVQQTYLLKAVCKVQRDELKDLDPEEALKFQYVTVAFLELQRFQFTKQMRSVDETHTRHLLTMRGPDHLSTPRSWLTTTC